MTGQRLYSDMHRQCWKEEFAHIRAIQSHSTKIVNVKTLSPEQVQGYAQFLPHLGSSKDEQSVIAYGLIPGRKKFEDADDEQKGRSQASYFFPVSPLNTNPNPICKPYIHWKRHHDIICVIDSKAAQKEGLESCQMVNGSVLCFHTKPPEFLERVTVINDVSASYARCKHYTHSALIFCRACGSRFKCLYCTFLRASSYKRVSTPLACHVPHAHYLIHHSQHRHRVHRLLLHHCSLQIELPLKLRCLADLLNNLLSQVMSPTLLLK